MSAKLQYNIPDVLMNKLRDRITQLADGNKATVAEAENTLQNRAMVAVLRNGKKGLDEVNREYLAMMESRKCITSGALVQALLDTVDKYSDEELLKMMMATGVRVGRPPST